MPKSQNASVKGKPIVCPVCGGKDFGSKKYRVAGEWQQIFKLEGAGGKGIMLICNECSYIQHFARRESVSLSA